MKTLVVALALLVGLASGLRAAQDDERVIEFNDQLVSILNVSEKPFEAYWEAVKPWYSGGKGNVKRISAALHVLEETHRQAYQELLDLEVPEGELCREFYNAVVDYFQIDREVIAALNSATKYMLKHNPPTNEEDVEHVDAMVDPILARQKAVFEQVRALQRRLAETHQFALK